MYDAFEEDSNCSFDKIKRSITDTLLDSYGHTCYDRIIYLMNLMPDLEEVNFDEIPGGVVINDAFRPEHFKTLL